MIPGQRIELGEGRGRQGQAGNDILRGGEWVYRTLDAAVETGKVCYHAQATRRLLHKKGRSTPLCWYVHTCDDAFIQKFPDELFTFSLKVQRDCSGSCNLDRPDVGAVIEEDVHRVSGHRGIWQRAIKDVPKFCAKSILN